MNPHEILGTSPRISLEISPNFPSRISPKIPSGIPPWISQLISPEVLLQISFAPFLLFIIIPPEIPSGIEKDVKDFLLDFFLKFQEQIVPEFIHWFLPEFLKGFLPGFHKEFLPGFFFQVILHRFSQVLFIDPPGVLPEIYSKIYLWNCFIVFSRDIFWHYVRYLVKLKFI